MLRSALESSKCDLDAQLADKPVIFFIYFDEAHVLTRSESTPDQPLILTRYHLLGRVLGKMNYLPFFTVFLSTSSWLGALAPSTFAHASIRDWSRVVLHPPFTELPFDTFAVDSFKTLSQGGLIGVKLDDVCKLEYVVKFGRPL